MKVRLAILAYQNKDKLLKIVGITLASTFFLVAAILSALDPFKDNSDLQDPYQKAYKYVVEMYNIDELSITTDQIKAVDLVMYEDITKRKENDIKDDIINYYIIKRSYEREVCNETNECSLEVIYYYTFNSSKEIIQKYQDDGKLSERQIDDIASMLELQQAAYGSSKGFNGQVPIASGDFVLPTAHGQVTCGVGCYPGHIGTDIGAPIGTALYSITDAVVIDLHNGCDNNGYLGNPCGNYITTVSNIDGIDTVIFYYHLSTADVEIGQEVKRGEQIGVAGNSGNSDGPHTHIEVIMNATYLENKSIRIGKYVDIEKLIDFPPSW